MTGAVPADPPPQAAKIRQRIDSGWEAAVRQLSLEGRAALDAIKKRLFDGAEGEPVPTAAGDDDGDELLVFREGGFEVIYTKDERKDGTLVFFFKSFADCDRLYQVQREVFLSYAHKDRVWFDRIRALLDRLAVAGDVTFWTDKQIEGGDRWHDLIVAKLQAATAAILLLTQHFMESSFIQDEELPVFLEKAERDAERYKAERLAGARGYLGFLLGWIPVARVEPALFAANASATAAWQRLNDHQAICDPAVPLDGTAETDIVTRLDSVGEQVRRFLQRAFQTEL